MSERVGPGTFGASSGGGGGTGTVKSVTSPTSTIAVTTVSTTVKLGAIAKVPSGALVAGTSVTLSTTSGKAKIASATTGGNLTASSNVYTPARSSNYNVTRIATPSANYTVASASGTAVNGDRLVLRIKSTSTAYTITWNSVYASSGTVTLPTKGVASKTITCGFLYTGSASKWYLLALTAKGY